MGNTLIIRNMTKEDIDGICEADEDFSAEFIDYLKRKLKNQEDDLCLALVAVCEGKIAGHVFVYKSLKWGCMGDSGLPGIADLKVFPAYRRRGIAGSLMDAAEQWAAKYCGRIWLEVCLNSEYGAAQRFYVRRGYVPDGKGMYYQEKIAPTDAICRNDDELTLCLIKEMRR